MNSSQEPMESSDSNSATSRVLTLFDCVCIIVGTIIGAGIFKMPAIVASNVPNVTWLVAVWVAGGLVALMGALCFAELTTTYPDRGGDYGYLKRGYHCRVGFAFSWAAFWVIRPTSIALMAMIFGEFAVSVFPNSLPLYAFAGLSVIGLSLTNLIGVRFGKASQNLLTVAKVAGILVVVAAAFLVWPSAEGLDQDVLAEVPAQISNAVDSASASEDSGESTWEWFWLSMVFVMFTFGGWNDIAFVASETRNPKRNLLRALVVGTGVVLLVYLLVNLALVAGLGFEQMASLGSRWENATSVLVEQNMGPLGKDLLSILVCVSCLGAINAMIFTSPRIYWATAVDYPSLRLVAGDVSGKGCWRGILLQGVVTIAYILTFGDDKNGVENLTASNAPYFWSFLGLTVVTLMINRVRFKGQFEGYRVPFYPVLPVLFVGACLFMVYRSWTYMMDQELWLATAIIGGWVLVGLILSFLLRNEAQQSLKQ
ncbi:MAG: amino acid permease [Mariniblastus sp.]|nr:amino acid permease [Mariniblastus sp.]MDG2183054.1 amino acid permease [Mariniblastus sp.]